MKHKETLEPGDTGPIKIEEDWDCIGFDDK